MKPVVTLSIHTKNFLVKFTLLGISTVFEGLISYLIELELVDIRAKCIIDIVNFT